MATRAGTVQAVAIVRVAVLTLTSPLTFGTGSLSGWDASLSPGLQDTSHLPADDGQISDRLRRAQSPGLDPVRPVVRPPVAQDPAAGEPFLSDAVVPRVQLARVLVAEPLGAKTSWWAFSDCNWRSSSSRWSAQGSAGGAFPIRFACHATPVGWIWRLLSVSFGG